MAQPNTRYDVSAASGIVNLTLPPFIMPGDFVSIRGLAGSRWRLIPNPSPGITARSDFTPHGILTNGLPGNAMPGATWDGQAVGITPEVIASNESGEVLVSAATNSLRISRDAGATWVAAVGVPASHDWVFVAARTPPFPMIISVPQTLLAVARGGGLYKSEGGRDWTRVSDIPGVGSADQEWRAVAADQGALNIAAAVFNGPIYRYGSLNGSARTWIAATLVGSSDVLVRPWRALASSAISGVMAAATEAGEVFVSTTGGATWVQRNVKVGGTTVTAAAWSRIAISDDGSTIAVAGERLGQMYLSRDRGQNWTQAGTPNGDYTAIAMSADASVIVATLRDTSQASFGSVQISRDKGTSFTRLATVAAGRSNWRAFAMSADGNQFAASADRTIYTSLGDRTSIGGRGFIEGGVNDFIEVEYLGEARYRIRRYIGGPFTIR